MVLYLSNLFEVIQTVINSLIRYANMCKQIMTNFSNIINDNLVFIVIFNVHIYILYKYYTKKKHLYLLGYAVNNLASISVRCRVQLYSNFITSITFYQCLQYTLVLNRFSETFIIRFAKLNVQSSNSVPGSNVFHLQDFHLCWTVILNLQCAL